MAASQLVFVLLEALACSYAWPDGSVSNIDTAAAQILWLPDHAVLARDLARSVIIKNGRSIYADSSGAVAFAIESDRAEVSDRVVRHFADAGWHQRSTQQLNPLLPTSYECGWETHGGGVWRRSVQETNQLEPNRTTSGEASGRTAAATSCATCLAVKAGNFAGTRIMRPVASSNLVGGSWGTSAAV